MRHTLSFVNLFWAIRCSYHAAQAQQCGESVDVLIVGAGMSGLAAATTLKREAPAVTYQIVESTDRVGGRVSTVDFDGLEVEEGAGWTIIIPSGRNDVPRLLDEYGISTQPFDFSDLSVYRRTASVGSKRSSSKVILTLFFFAYCLRV